MKKNTGVKRKRLTKKEMEYKKNCTAESKLREERRIKKEKDIESILRFCKKHFPSKEWIDSSKVFAKAIDYFTRPEDSKKVGQFHIELTIAAFVQQKIIDNIPDIDFIYDQLVKLKYTERNPYTYNDMDSAIFYIPVKEKIDKYTLNVFAMTSQNTRYLVVRRLHEDKELEREFDIVHVYRYWDKWKAREKWNVKENIEYKKKGITHSILHADELCQCFSDNVRGLKYGPDRPDIGWYKKHMFKTRYNDCRDGGFVCGWEKYHNLDSDTIYRYHDISTFFLELRWAFEQMRNRALEYERNEQL